MKRLLIALSSLLIISCEPTHKDDHGHDHEEGGGHEHEEEAERGHGESHTVTKFGERVELFVEYQPLVAGSASNFFPHFTLRADYQPVRAATVSVVLTSADSPGERWDVSKPSVPGLFTLRATPKYVGERDLLIIVKTPEFTEQFSFGKVVVFADKEQAGKVHIENPTGEISFSKEQQWKVDFGVTPVARRELRPSVAVSATIRPASQGEAVVTAPFDGRVSIASETSSQVGQRVEVGDVVAYVVPNLGASEIASMRSELRKSEVQLSRAERELKRLEGLVGSGAVASKRLQDAESEKQLAVAERDQARRRLRQSQSLQSKGRGGEGRVAIRSPIDGTIAQRSLVDGGFVKSGDQLLHVVDRSQLWLEANVAEADLPRIKNPTGVWFKPAGIRGVEGNEETEAVEIQVDENGGLVSFGEVIDPHTRTVPLIFAINAASNRDLRVGAFVKAHVLSGASKNAIAIPSSAVLDEKGLPVVFVMKNGESFERRVLRLGVRDRNMVEVIDGLDEGEYVVSRGSYYVKLAGTATAAAGHGHAH